jgi:S1-C subfamily serine protease
MEIAMIDKISDPSTKKIRSRALLGSALALVLGAGVIGGAVLPTQTSPALAEAVQVQGVQPISFADVVDKVRPAVVSVRVKSVAKNDDATGNSPSSTSPKALRWRSSSSSFAVIRAAPAALVSNSAAATVPR